MREFSGADLSVEAVLASACLPELFAPVVIDGEAYWDGGYSANPALSTLYRLPATEQVLLVQLDAVEPLNSLPNTREEMASHASQLAFAAPLAAELRMLSALSSRMGLGLGLGLGPGPGSGSGSGLGANALPKLHILRPARGLHGLNAASKLNTDWAFLQQLFEAGRACADAWVQQFVEQRVER